MKRMKKKFEKNLKYEIELTWDMESGGKAYVRDFPPLELDMPEEFGGKSRFPCPDEFFFSAIGGCVLTTFLHFKEKLKLKLKGLQVTVQGTVNPANLKGYRITSIEVLIDIEVDERERSKAEKCAELARDYCHLTRSLEHGIPIKVWSDIKTRD